MTAKHTDPPMNGDDFEQMVIEALTLALLRLTCWKEGKGEFSYYRAWKGYDFGTLDALQEQGFVTFERRNKSLELTDDGFFFGDVFAARFGMALSEALNDKLHPGHEDAPSPSGFSVVDGGLDDDSAVLAPSGAHSPFDVADGMPPAAFAPFAPAHDIPGAASGTPMPYGIPLADRPTFDPTEGRRDNDTRAFRLRIDLDLEGLHPCWREIEIPATCTFLDLHIAIQRIFNWYDEHLFSIRATARGQKLWIDEASFAGSMFDPFAPPECAVVEASRIQLGDVFPKTRTAQYLYDFGDGWEHKIKVVKTIAKSSLTAPRLVDGEGDAPPEDVGGPGGFEYFLEAISDRKHPEHGDMLAWAESQMAHPFDLVEKQQELIKSWKGDRALWAQNLAEGRSE